MLRLALGKFATSKTSRDVADIVRTQGEVDLSRLVTSMGIVHYLAWAIPAIGFLGTVEGLAGSLTMGGKTKEDVATFISQATGHLNIAFDCTLVAAGPQPRRDGLPAHRYARREPRHRLPAILPRTPRQPALRARVGWTRRGTSARGDDGPLARAGGGGQARLRRQGEVPAMSLVGLDNASRAPRVAGPSAQKLSLLRLDGDHVELPLALSLDGRVPTAGHAGLAATAAPRPHLACLDFLPYLGSSRTWQAGDEGIDAEQALELTFDAHEPVDGPVGGNRLHGPGLPGRDADGAVLPHRGTARLPLVGSISAPVAAVLASPYVHDAADEKGLAAGDRLRRARADVVGGGARPGAAPAHGAARLAPGQGRVAAELLDGVASRCVRTSRAATRARVGGDGADGVRAAHRHAGPGAPAHRAAARPGRRLVRQPDAAGRRAGRRGRAALLRQFAADLESVFATAETLGRLACVVVTHSAAACRGWWRR